MKLNLYIFWQWLRRDLLTKYRGSVLGSLWAIVQPLAQVLVFTLVFHEFFGMRWPQSNNIQHSAVEYGMNVFIGLATFTFFAEILSRSPQSLLAQPNLVSKVRFPLLILPTVTVSVASLSILIAIFFILPFNLRTIHWMSVFFLPIILLPILLYGLGLAWCLSALNLYLRDIGHVTTPFSNLLLFLSPVFYPASSVPERMAWLNIANPIAWAAELLRDLVSRGEPPNFRLWICHTIASLLLALIGLRLFDKLKSGFSDAL